MRIGFLKKGAERTRGRKGQRRALTRVDVVAVLFAILLLAILFVTVLPPQNRPVHGPRIMCVENLRQVGEALRVWENDAGPRMALLETNAQTIGLNSGQIPWINAVGSSRIAHLAKVLHCPADTETPITTNSDGIKIRISYFLNLDANGGYPQEILSGDDNFAVNGVPVKRGIFEVSSNTPISWTTGRHGVVDNIGLADGSVDQVSRSMLNDVVVRSFEGTPLFTNRFAVP